jgi:hypothetical protein
MKNSLLIRLIRRILIKIINHNLFHHMKNESYLKLIFWIKTGDKLNLKNPRMYNEKIQWLKLNDYKEFYTYIVDKLEVRRFVKEKIGEKFLIPLLAVYSSEEKIDFHSLPDKFVMKTNHGSGSIIICNDKSQLDFDLVRKRMKNWLNKNWFWYGRAYPYKNIKPKIIVEEFMGDDFGNPPKDYKIFCFDGEPKVIVVDIDRFKNHRRNFYNINWEFIDVETDRPNDKNITIEKPEKLPEMLYLSRKLSEGFKHVRIDLYIIKNEIKFGEITLYPWSGFIKFSNPLFEKDISDWLDISE